VVSVPFDTIYVWGNYFRKYEYLSISNKDLKNIISKTFEIDSTQNKTNEFVINTFKTIIRNDSTIKVNLNTKIEDRDKTIDKQDIKINTLTNDIDGINKYKIPAIKTNARIGGILIGFPIGALIAGLYFTLKP
jgi:hypothetical protein